MSISKEKSVPKVSEVTKEKAKEPIKRSMVFAANKAGPKPISTTVQKDAGKVRPRVLEPKVTPPSAGNPSKLMKLEQNIKDDSATTKSRVVARRSSDTKALAENIRTRKLAMVLQSEQRLQEQNLQLELQIKQLQEQLFQKDDEIERLKSSGLLLNNLANSQSDEVRGLKLRLKETYDENVEVREICEKLEKQRQEACVLKKEAGKEDLKNQDLELQFAALTAQFRDMGVDRAQPRKPSASDPACEEVTKEQPGATHDYGNSSNDVLPSEVQHSNSASEVDDGELGLPNKPGKLPEWSLPIEELTEVVPVCGHPEESLVLELSAVGNHEELLAAIRAVQDEHEGDHTVLSKSMRGQLEVIEDFQNAIKVLETLPVPQEVTDE